MQWGMFPISRSGTRGWGFRVGSRKFPGTRSRLGCGCRVVFVWFSCASPGRTCRVSRKLPGTLRGCRERIAVGYSGRTALAVAFRAGLALGFGVRIGVELDERSATGVALGLVVSVRVVAADTWSFQERSLSSYFSNEALGVRESAVNSDQGYSPEQVLSEPDRERHVDRRR